MATLNVTEAQFEELILKEGTSLEEIIGKVAELDMDDVVEESLHLPWVKKPDV